MENNAMHDFDDYIRQGEPSRKEKAQIWQTAIGLQDVDGLKPSAYLLETAAKNIEGDITFDEVNKRIDTYYKSATIRNAENDDRTEEADKVSARIAEILSEKTFSFSPAEFIGIHRRLFRGIYKFAGKIRDYNITKNEWVLDGETVLYASADMLRETLEYDFKEEKNFIYEGLSTQQIIEHLAHFVAYLWQIHIFGEGNTRTTAVFLIKFLRKLGFKNADNTVFARHSWYFRNALVRANYEDLSRGIHKTNIFLIRFLENTLLGGTNELKNRTMHIHFKEQDLQMHSDLKIKNENLKEAGQKEEKLGIKLGIKLGANEIEIIELINKNPLITIPDMSDNLKITETAVENNLAKLKKKGIIERIGARKNGSWKIISIKN
jgi:fido (protein-threonine AMPylation protein)/DNA-binding MarR family transcriptional regulator